ncbi:hypothetical protein PybrP1_012478 [[Pythium] brassicae (nom. inval.)]|nr:hypothetical protein PybrP1_012478 [[Pythium] brassicae (nom. inval.)]
MELVVVYRACEYYVDVVTAATASPDRVALPLELLQLQLFSLVGVAPHAQLLLSSRSEWLLPPPRDAVTDSDELLLPLHEGERRPRLFLLERTEHEAALPSDWQSVCSRAAFGAVPVVQRAFATSRGSLVCHACATTCTTAARPLTPTDWTADDAIARRFISEVAVVVGDVDVPSPPGFERLPEDLNHSASGDHVYLCVKRGGHHALTQLRVDVSGAGGSSVDSNSGNPSAARVHVSADSVFRASDADALGTFAITDVRVVVGAEQAPPTPAHVRIPRNLNDGVPGASVQPIFLWYAAAPLGAFTCDAGGRGHSAFGECLFQSRHANELRAVGDLDARRLEAAALLARARAAADDAERRTLYASGEAAMRSRLQSVLARAQSYESRAMQDEALKRIPVQILHERARANPAPLPSFRDELVQQLLRWFKREFFTWTNQPACRACGCADTALVRTVGPSTPEERAGDAGRVEVYQCPACSALTRFPRYNNPVTLLDSRTGRCGEWANCFTLCCRALGFEARYVLDVTDHVWTEVYSEHAQRWLHCDACEEQLDCPLTYEAGWGKQLSYIFSAAHDEVVDSARRYTQHWDAMRARRQEVSEQWLRATIAQMNDSLRSASGAARAELLRTRAVVEEAELARGRAATAGEAQGRVSGSAEWKRQRSEDGKQQAVSSATAAAAVAEAEQQLADAEALAVELSQQLCKTMLLGCENPSCPNPYCRLRCDPSVDMTERAANAIRLVGSFNQRGFSPASLASLLCPPHPSELRWFVLARRPLVYLPLQDAGASSGAPGWLVDSSGGEHHVLNSARCPVRKPFRIPHPDAAAGSYGVQVLPRQSLVAERAVPLDDAFSLSFLVRFDSGGAPDSAHSPATAVNLLKVVVGSRVSLAFRASRSERRVTGIACELQVGDSSSSSSDDDTTELSFGSYAHVGLVQSQDATTVLVNGRVALDVTHTLPAATNPSECAPLTLLGPERASIAQPAASAVVSHLAVFQQQQQRQGEDDDATDFAAFCRVMTQRFVRAPSLVAFDADGACPDKRCTVEAANAQRRYRVAKVLMWGDEFFDGIQFVYEVVVDSEHEGDDTSSSSSSRLVIGPLVGNAHAVASSASPSAQLRLFPGEVVTAVSGRKGAWTDSVRVATSFGRDVVCGGPGGGDFRVQVPSGSEVRAVSFAVGDHLVDPVVFACDDGAAARIAAQSDELRELQASLKDGSSTDRKNAVSAALRYLENIASHPQDVKFHKIRTSNAFFAKSVGALGVDGSRAFMRWCGFQPLTEDDATFFVLVEGDSAEQRSSEAAERLEGSVHRRISTLKRFNE